MELSWVGYRICIRVQKHQGAGKPVRAATEVPRPHSSRRQQGPEERYLLASGSRFVAPAK
jgi:hypothetical protein